MQGLVEAVSIHLVRSPRPEHLEPGAVHLREHIRTHSNECRNVPSVLQHPDIRTCRRLIFLAPGRNWREDSAFDERQRIPIFRRDAVVVRIRLSPERGAILSPLTRDDGLRRDEGRTSSTDCTVVMPADMIQGAALRLGDVM